jgi:hypothetical protein
MTAGSSTAEAARTLDRIFKKCGFEEKELGVGGRVGVVPMARRRVGGEVGRRVRTWWFGREGCGKWWIEGLEARVEEKRLLPWRREREIIVYCGIACTVKSGASELRSSNIKMVDEASTNEMSGK